MDLITIYIITRNRPKLILRSVQSALQQCYSNIKVIVSDNSTNNLTYKLFKENPIDDKRFVYLDQKGRFKSFADHTNYIHDIVDTQYYMIFHDDDEMLPGMIHKMYALAISNNNVIAVGSNAFIKKNNRVKSSFFRLKRYELIQSPQKLVKQYLLCQIAPYPSYLYNKGLLSNHRIMLKNGGMYSDVAFLLSLLDSGVIAIISERLMIYHLHSDQGSNSYSFIDSLSLARYMKNDLHIDKKIITLWRISNIYNELTRARKVKKKALALFCKYSPLNYFIKYVVRLLLIKSSIYERI